jgi:4-hydroxy-3-methylbut-2-enyl diphosphate reductase
VIVPAAPATVIVVAATGAEARPARRRLRDVPGTRVELAGIALSRWRPRPTDTVVSYGLAGGLDASLGTGAVVIPDAVAGEDGQPLRCDEELVARLRAAARTLSIEPHPGPLLTTRHVVTGADRGTWARRGYAAVDMESSLVGEAAARFAVLRVVLDTEARELSPAWEHPMRAIARPWLWGEAAWLARTVPRQCDVLARILATALSSTP